MSVPLLHPAIASPAIPAKRHTRHRNGLLCCRVSGSPRITSVLALPSGRIERIAQCVIGKSWAESYGCELNSRLLRVRKEQGGCRATEETGFGRAGDFGQIGGVCYQVNRTWIRHRD